MGVILGISTKRCMRFRHPQYILAQTENSSSIGGREDGMEDGMKYGVKEDLRRQVCTKCPLYDSESGNNWNEDAEEEGVVTHGTEIL